MLELGTIHHGEALELMSQIDDKSIDLIICDLPYGTTKNPWDNIIPFEGLWKEYKRIIKDNGAIILFAQGMFTSQLMESNKKMWRYNLIWEKDRPSGFLNAKRMPLRNHEDILVYYKKLPTYHPQFWEGRPLHGMGKKFREGHLGNNNYGKFASHQNPSAEREGDTTKFPRSVLKFPKPHPPIHPTQKPVELLEWLIKSYSEEGQVILDNCSGSGSTLIAAMKCNRQFIGIEIEETYVRLIEERIETYRDTGIDIGENEVETEYASFLKYLEEQKVLFSEAEDEERLYLVIQLHTRFQEYIYDKNKNELFEYHTSEKVDIETLKEKISTYQEREKSLFENLF